MKFCLSLKHTKANISLNLQSCRFMYQAINNNYFWKLWSEEGIERRKVSLWTLYISKKWQNSRWLFRHFFLVVSYNFQIRWNIFKNKLWSLCVLSQLSHVRLLVTLWTIAHQAPLSTGNLQARVLGGLPCLPPGIFLTQELNLCLLGLLHWQASSLPLVPLEKPKCLINEWGPGYEDQLKQIQWMQSVQGRRMSLSRTLNIVAIRRWYGEGNGNPLQYSCVENPMGGGAWWAAVHGVAKSWTRLSDFTFTFHFHALEKEMATHCSVLAWRIPGTGEPGGLPSMGSHRVGHVWSDLAAAAAGGDTDLIL